MGIPPASSIRDPDSRRALTVLGLGSVGPVLFSAVLIGAYALTQHRDQFFASVEGATLDRFEALITLLNGTISANG